MSIKNLFNKTEISEKVLPIVSLEEIGTEVESAEFVKKELENKNRFIPYVDFSNPTNFVKFGLAEQYYEDAINYIKNDYPYDGSKREKVEWELSASYLDKYIFENEYPRTNGYINLGVNYGSIISASSGYNLFSSNNYIFFKGGPNSASNGMSANHLYETFSLSNLYDSGSRRESNLEIDGSNGLTVEFWLKKNGFTTSSIESTKQVIFDLWNSSSYGNSDYGRFRVEIHPGISGEERQFFIELMSGSSGLSDSQSFNVIPIGVGLNLTGSGWNQFSLSVVNNGSNMIARLYASGSINDTIITGSSIGLVQGPMIATLGSLVAPISGTNGGFAYASLSASLDEFRYWKSRRTAKQIGRYWFTQVGAGTNTDDANTQLGVYYKFNEGIISTGSVNNVDAKILDYSGRVSNGRWTGYTTGSRNTGSAFVESGLVESEFQDPILYSEHSLVSSLINNKKEIGYSYDIVNNSSLYSSFPEWITADDEEKEHRVLRKMTQVLASYLDNLYLQMETLPRIKDATYISGSSKPYPFVSRLLESVGMIAPEIFSDAEELEAIAARDDFKEFEEKLYDVKNKIYQNVYNNLVFMYKSKGTEKAFRNLIRCFGVDDELIKINLYGDNITYDFKDNRRYSVARKKYADFNNVDRFDCTVYQTTSSSPSSRSYIAAPSNVIHHGATFECETVFPKKFEKDSQLHFHTPYMDEIKNGV